MNEKQILKVKVLFGNCFLAQFLFSRRKKIQKIMYDNNKLFTIFFLQIENKLFLENIF